MILQPFRGAMHWWIAPDYTLPVIDLLRDRCVQGKNQCLFKGADDVQHLSSILCKSCVFCNASVHFIIQQHFKGQ